MIPLLPDGAWADESDAARLLAQRPPWVPPGADDGDDSRTDRGLRAHVRRWIPADEPTPRLVFALGDRLGDDRLGRLSEPGLHRLAVVAHLLSLLPATGRAEASVGRACARAGMLPSRFARLVDTPRPYRADALARAFRQIGAAGVRLAPGAMPDLLAFLFSPDRARGDDRSTTRTVTRWAQDFFHVRAQDDADVTDAAPEAAGTL